MLGILQDILCAVLGAGAMVLWALVSALNLIILGVGSAIGGLLGLLPAMPAPIDGLDGDVLQVVNYVLPVAGLVAALLTFVALWSVFLLVRIPLRWVKAL